MWLLKNCAGKFSSLPIAAFSTDRRSFPEIRAIANDLVRLISVTERRVPTASTAAGTKLAVFPDGITVPKISLVTNGVTMPNRLASRPVTAKSTMLHPSRDFREKMPKSFNVNDRRGNGRQKHMASPVRFPTVLLPAFTVCPVL